MIFTSLDLFIIFIIILLFYYIYNHIYSYPQNNTSKKKLNLQFNIPVKKITFINHILKNKEKDKPIENENIKEIVIDDNDIKYYSNIQKAFEQEKQIRGYDERPVRQYLDNQIFRENPLNLQIQTLPIYQPLNIDFTLDGQNVHSSLVQDTIKNKYSKIKTTSTELIDKSKIKIINKHEIINYAKKYKKNHNEINAILQKIENRNSNISNIDSSEIKVLNDTWNSANENIKVQILNELLDAHSSGYLVCPTGVVSRIINSDIVENPTSTPRTEENLRKEMLHTASKIRNDLENDPVYIKLSDEKQIKMLKDTLIDKYTKDYKNIISEERIQKELDSWLDYI